MLVPLDKETGQKKKNLTKAESADMKDRLDRKIRDDKARAKK